MARKSPEILIEVELPESELPFDSDCWLRATEILLRIQSRISGGVGSSEKTAG